MDIQSIFSAVMQQFTVTNSADTTNQAVQVDSDSAQYNNLTYNYSGGNIPRMSILGLPSDMPTPDLPTSIPTVSDSVIGHTMANINNHYIAYSPDAVEMSSIGIPTGSPFAADVPVSIPGQSTAPAQDLSGIAQGNSIFDIVSRALLGGTLHAAPVNTQGASSVGQAQSVLPTDNNG